MQKRKLSRHAELVSASIKTVFAFFFLALLFFGCKSAPIVNPVDPAELLSSDRAIYMTVPVQPNEEFVVRAVEKIAGCSEKDARKIAERTEKIYISVGSLGEVELAAKGDFPSNMIGFALTEKKGWKKTTFKEYQYFTGTQSSYQISLPSPEVAVVAQNIEPMLEKYDDAANNDLHQVSMDEEIYAFLENEESGSIEVFAPVPKAFIRTFIGANVNSPVQSISGTFTNISAEKEFGLKLSVKMNDPRTMKAAVAALKIALFPIPAKVVQSGESTISVTDITLGYDELLKFMK